MMTKHAALLAASIGAFAVAAAPAAHATIVVDFSFSDQDPSRGTVTGVLYFADNGTDIGAESVELTSVSTFTPVDFSFNQNLLTDSYILSNDFTLADNNIQSADLELDIGPARFYLNTDGSFNDLRDIDSGNRISNAYGFTGVTYTTVSPPPLPEPMSLALLAAGIGGLAVLRRRS